MRVAIAGLEDQVAPRLEHAAYVLLATFENGPLCGATIRSTRHLPSARLASFLVDRGVSRVVCGGVLREQQERLENAGIEVVWGVIGPIVAALAAVAGGTLGCDQFVTPAASADLLARLPAPVLQRITRCANELGPKASGQETLA
jgi:predicted Fe-Mo cluster-binding NifX family protein